MIVSELYEIKKTKNLTRNIIENFFREKNIEVVKWAIVGDFQDNIKILASIEKKTL